jgi:hypothetical protein
LPRYVIHRKFDVGADGMPEIGAKSRRVIRDQVPEVTWIHSHVAMEEEDSVHTFCLYDAPDMAAIDRHAVALGHHTIIGVFEVAGDVTPEDFPIN